MTPKACGTMTTRLGRRFCRRRPRLPHGAACTGEVPSRCPSPAFHPGRQGVSPGSTRQPCRGFTLPEIIVVLSIVGILGIMGAASYQRYIEKIQVLAVVADIRNIDKTIAAYKALAGSCPADLKTIGMDQMRDRWGQPYRYLRVQDAKKSDLRKDRSLHPVNSDYDLYSVGKDGKTNTPFTAKASQDDIVRANDGAYVGLVSEY